jgi:hypothetical protein
MPTQLNPWTFGLAVASVFFVADFVYALDHYLVHHDRARYRVTHRIHHVRYGGRKHEPHLDRSELSTYGSAAFMSLMATSVLSLFSGNPGFVAGSVLKFAHTLLFHLYQHRWWGPVHLRAQRLGKPLRSWGLASARYHAWHHSNPDDPPFTYAESWAGFDRILEWLHPWLVRHTTDGHSKIDPRRSSDEALAARRREEGQGEGGRGV